MKQGFLLLLMLLGQPFMYAEQTRWLERKAEGWFWYEDKAKQVEQTESPSPKEMPLPPVLEKHESPPLLTAAEEMALLRKDLEEKLAEAILRPTVENVAAYMKMQNVWINQSAQFSQAWVKNLLQYPELDGRLTDFPVTQYGVQVQKQIIKEDREARIQELAKNHGLFFFYEGKHKVSQACAIVVKEFAQKYAWQVIAITCDGEYLAGFDHHQLDTGIRQRLGVQALPALFLVEPQRQVALPIGYGLVAIDQIEANIDLQMRN